MRLSVERRLQQPRWLSVAVPFGSVLVAFVIAGVVLLATGKSKAAIVRRALEGAITTRVPASLLQAHPHVVAVLDREAAALLLRKSKGRR